MEGLDKAGAEQLPQLQLQGDEVLNTHLGSWVAEVREMEEAGGEEEAGVRVVGDWAAKKAVAGAEVEGEKAEEG